MTDSKPSRPPLALPVFISALFGGAIVALLLTSVPLWSVGTAVAGTFFKGHRGCAHDPECIQEHVGKATEWALSEVGATAEQEAEVSAIVSRLVADLMALDLHGDDLHDTLHSQITAPEIDRAALNSLRAEKLAMVDQASTQVLDAAVAIGGVLSAEQRRELLDSFHEHHRGHGHRRWHH